MLLPNTLHNIRDEIADGDGFASAGRAYIEARIKIEDRGFSSPCWIWQLGLTVKGYGRCRLNGHLRSHRASYEAFVGPIPGGLQIDHLCRIKSCCNPDHLEPVTNRENVIRGLAACGFVPRSPRKNKPTHCTRGHEYTPENTAIVSRGRYKGRQCRACARGYARARYARNPQAINLYQAEWRRKRSAAKLETGGGEQPGSAADLRTHEGPSRQSLGSVL